MEKWNNPKLSKQDLSEVIYGIRPVIEAIQSGKEIEKLLIQKEQQGPLLSELLNLCKEFQIPVHKVPQAKLDTITRKNHQGVICYLSPVQFASLDHIITATYQKGASPLLVILDRVTDVRNFGAISRTAECLGAHGIIIPAKGNARVGEDAVKTSAGALNYIPLIREHNLKTTIDYLKENGIIIAGCTEKAEKTIYESDLSGPLAIIMGSEEEGISPEYLRRCDIQVKIPQYGKIASLNVSVAAGMILSEAIRQRNFR